MSDTNTEVEQQVRAAIATIDQLVAALNEEVDLLKQGRYSELRAVNARKSRLGDVLESVADASARVSADGALAQDLRAAQQRLGAALERAQQVNAAHQDAVARLRDIIRNSDAETNNDGTYSPRPPKRETSGHKGITRDV